MNRVTATTERARVIELLRYVLSVLEADETAWGPVDFVPIGNDGTSVWLLDNTEPFFQRPLS